METEETEQFLFGKEIFSGFWNIIVEKIMILAKKQKGIKQA